MAVLVSFAILVLLGIAASRKLGERVDRVERRVTKLERVPAAAKPPPAAEAREMASPPAPTPPAPKREAGPPRPAVALELPERPAARAIPAAGARAPKPQPRMRPAEPAAAETPDEDPLEGLLAWVWRWLTTGNVPAKVGVLLSILGVGFLVKEGIDRHWLVLPLAVRLSMVAAFGAAMLVLGWRLRARERGYGLTLQGGGIGVLYVTTYAAYALYGLLGPTLAFGLLFAVTVAAVLLAVLQDTMALAMLGIVAGFLAPLLTATDSGNHVALFGYYALLDLAIFTIAWFKAWRSLNVLGFVFTFGIGALWGSDAYRPELFATVEPFLVLFAALYIAIPVLFALRQPPELRGYVDGTLVFGTPIIGFGLQALLVADTRYGLAISAVALAVTYGALSAFVRRYAAELRVLSEAQFALGVVFIVLAVPLALDAHWTSVGWALQGAALVWLGRRQQRRLPLLTGTLLQGAAAVSYLVSMIDTGWFAQWPAAVVLALAGAWSSRVMDTARADDAADESPAVPAAATAFLLWGTAWWLWAGFAASERHLADAFVHAGYSLFVATTVALALLGAALFDWRRLAAVGLVAWPLAALLFVATFLTASHPAANLGWLTWPVLFAMMYVFLRVREAQFPSLAGALHTVVYWLASALLVAEIHWQVARIATGDWAAAATSTAASAIVLATLGARRGLAWPLGAHARVYVKACAAGVVAVLAVAVVIANATFAGDAAPLPYVPLANPLELASALALFVAIRWLTAFDEYYPPDPFTARQRAGFAAAYGMFLLTMAVARAVHHFAGVPFDVVSLTRSTVLQASLSLVWGAAALLAMVLGARRAARSVWLAGAALMAIVVVKLLLVDLGNNGTLERIVSFLGVGVLLLVVGYFAPVPPREVDEPA